jgi:D-sedoheptulose 7-phosphate isomerase
MSDHYGNYMATLGEVLGKLPSDELATIEHDIRSAWKEGRRLFLMGNGGSAATASHLICDFAKGLSQADRPRLKAIALTDNTPIITAYGNDLSYDVVFAEQLDNLVEPGDVVLAISGSGNSPNVLRAIELANERGALTVGLTGFQGGKLKGLVKRCVVVASDNMQQIEDAHLIIGHALFLALRDGAFD